MIQIVANIKIHPWKIYWRVFFWVAIIWVTVPILYLSLAEISDFPFFCGTSYYQSDFCSPYGIDGLFGGMLILTPLAVPTISGYIFVLLKLFPQNTDAGNVKIWKRIGMYILIAPVLTFLFAFIFAPFL